MFDELLEGTNSKDRRIGAESLIRAICSNATPSALSPPTISLSQKSLPPSATSSATFTSKTKSNANEMLFDYKLRDGVVTKSNAIALMRIVGLEM